MNLVRKEIAFLPPFSKNQCRSVFLYVEILSIMVSRDPQTGLPCSDPNSEFTV